MRNKKASSYFKGLIPLILLAFFITGGCDTDFGGGDPDDDDRDISDLEAIEGTVVSVTPAREEGVDNINVEATKETGARYLDATGSDRFFRVRGNLSGMTQLEFSDGDSLGITNVNVFPRATVDIGDISLENGTVVFEQDIITSFEAEVDQNNCSGNSGSVEVIASNDITVDVQVQIINTTTIQDNGDVISCDDLLAGDDVQISGVLLSGNSVEAQVVIRE